MMQSRYDRQGARKHDDKESMLGSFGGEDETTVATTGMTVSQCNQMVKKGFLRKVYGILSIQLLATAVVCAMAMKMTSSELVGTYKVLSFGSFLVSSTGFQIAVFVFALVLLVALMCNKNTYPLNMYLLALWTLVMAFSVATSCTVAMCDPMVKTTTGDVLPLSLALTDGTPKGMNLISSRSNRVSCAVDSPKAEKGSNAVLMAAAITSVIFVSLTGFTVQSKIDFSFLGAGLFACLMIMMLFSFGMMIFGFNADLYFGYCVGGAIVFSLYIVYDTYMIHNRMGPDDYVMAAIDLYLDLINLFIFILQLLSKRD